MTHVRQNIDAYTRSFFTLGNRCARFLWGIVWFLFFRPSPRPCHWWRSFLLRVFGARIGRGCHVYPRARVWAPWNLIMDDASSLADDVICESMDRVSLGKKVVVSQGTYLSTGSHDYGSRNFQLVTQPIRVGDGAWLCAEAFVLPGVTIGEGAVIGARSVVTKDMPEWTVCAGNPCRPLKKRVPVDE